MRVSSLSFVLPMFNEEGNIRKMLEETVRTGRVVAREFEVVVVNDASTDKSPEIVAEMVAAHPEIRLINHEVNQKLGGTLRTGFAAATKEYILYIDSDLPIDMDEVPPAFELIKFADVVIGYRISRAEGMKRAVMSWCYNRLIRVVFGLKVIDVNFAFKLFRRDILNDITLCSKGSFIDAELLIEATKRGCRIKEYGLNYYPRTAGVSNLSGLNIVFKILGEMRDYALRSGSVPKRYSRQDETVRVLKGAEAQARQPRDK